MTQTIIILDKIQIKSYVHIIYNHLPHKHNVYTIAPPLSPLLEMSDKEVRGVGLGLGVGGVPIGGDHHGGPLAGACLAW